MLDDIVNFCSYVVGIIEFFFQMIVALFDLIFKGIEILIRVVSFLPTPFIVTGSALVVICCLYKILGRESSD